MKLPLLIWKFYYSWPLRFCEKNIWNYRIMAKQRYQLMHVAVQSGNQPTLNTRSRAESCKI